MLLPDAGSNKPWRLSHKSSEASGSSSSVRPLRAQGDTIVADTTVPGTADHEEDYDEFDDFLDDISSSAGSRPAEDTEKTLAMAQLYAVPPFPLGAVFQDRHRVRAEREWAECYPEFDETLQQALECQPLPDGWKERKLLTIPSRAGGVEAGVNRVSHTRRNHERLHSNATDRTFTTYTSASEPLREACTPRSTCQTSLRVSSSSSSVPSRTEHAVDSHALPLLDQEAAKSPFAKDLKVPNEPSRTRSDHSSITQSLANTSRNTESADMISSKDWSPRTSISGISRFSKHVNNQAARMLKPSNARLTLPRVSDAGCLRNDTDRESSDSEPEALFATDVTQDICNPQVGRAQRQTYAQNLSCPELLKDRQSRRQSPLPETSSKLRKGASDWDTSNDACIAQPVCAKSSSSVHVSDSKPLDQVHNGNGESINMSTQNTPSKQACKPVNDRSITPGNKSESSMPGGTSDRPVAATGYWADVREDSKAAKRITDGRPCGEVNSSPDGVSRLCASITTKQPSSKTPSSSRSSSPQAAFSRSQSQQTPKRSVTPKSESCSVQGLPARGHADSATKSARGVPVLPGRGRKLFSIQVAETDKTHYFPVHEFDDAETIAREVRFKFEPTNPGFSEDWETSINEMYRKKCERLRRRDARNLSGTSQIGSSS